MTHALPAPSRDELGDNVRVITWEPALPLPGLSRFARTWLQVARVRKLPPSIASRVYAERERALRALVQSREFRDLLGARTDVDQLVPLPGNPDARAAGFQHMFQASPDAPAARVMNARVSVHFGVDPSTVSLVTSSFQPDLEPPALEVLADEAALTAIDYARETGAGELAVAPTSPPELQVLRKPAPLGGARPRSMVRRANDRDAWRVRLINPDAAVSQAIDVLIDGFTGEVRELKPLTFDGNFDPGGDPADTYKAIPIPQLYPILNLVLCWVFDGYGTDPEGVGRYISTARYSWAELYAGEDPYLDRPYAMVSCNERPERLIGAQDVITLRADTLDVGLSSMFRDNDDIWFEEIDPQNPTGVEHAVSSQFWGERAVRTLKKRGYVSRVAGGQPVRYVAQYTNQYKKDFAKYIPYEPTTFPTGVLEGNGIVKLGRPGPVFRTSAGASFVAHEFAHSVYYDATATNPSDNSEMKTIDEGLADCLAMVALNDARLANLPPNLPNELGPQYQILGPEAPFHLSAGDYEDPTKVALGFPNLANPHDSFGPGASNLPSNLVYTYWAGQQSQVLLPGLDTYEANSTLLGGVCKLLVTGGFNPQLPTSEVETFALGTPLGQPSTGGGADWDVGHDRLAQLLLYTWTEAKSTPPTLHDLIDIMAADTEQLSKTEGWNFTASRERIRRTFAQYGFGRGQEQTGSHNAQDVSKLGGNAAMNLIGVGRRYGRVITGSVCTGEEDFFAVNERAAAGDTLHYNISGSGGSKFEVRLYREGPCAFEEGVPKNCSKARQLYPQPDSTGATPQSNIDNPQPSANVTFIAGDGPGDPPGNLYHRWFVGVRLAQAQGSCEDSYDLEVGIVRASGNEVYP
ncbi:MAG: hypothetical protein KC776_05800 [Myxococcales bacterium]|nr:hypothetical protein [Myxococcales bacterium]